MSPIELLKLCKVDMTKSGPVEEALNVFKEYLNRMKEV